jgi:hypothetical protein
VLVYCVSYVCVVSGLYNGLITLSKKFYRMCVFNYVWSRNLEKRGSLSPIWSLAPQKKCYMRQNGEPRNLQLSPNAVTIPVQNSRRMK